MNLIQSKFGTNTLFAIRYLTIVSLTCGHAAVGFTQEILSKDWLIERTEITEYLGYHTEFSVENLFGDVRIRTSNDDLISIFAIVQRHVNDMAKPNIILTTEGSVLKAEVIYPSVSDNELQITGDAYEKRRVDISVLAPKDAPLNIRTKHGRAESKGQNGSINARTIAGFISIVTNGSIDAQSESGNIKVTFPQKVWKGPSRIKSTTGNIDVSLMTFPDVLVDISTAGAITTDYSLDIESFPGTSFKRAKAKIGDSSNRLELISQIGTVRINRIFEMINSKQEISTTE